MRCYPRCLGPEIAGSWGRVPRSRQDCPSSLVSWYHHALGQYSRLGMTLRLLWYAANNQKLTRHAVEPNAIAVQSTPQRTGRAGNCI
eukprot:364234-Rhodomonas_salina.2